MDYAQTIEYLYSRLPMFSRMGAAAIKKDLHNTLALCEALGHPEKSFPSIHVAGTNGKGSTSHMLASILQSAGYRTGLYTSPHLRDFRERIRIDGIMVPEETVVQFTADIRPTIERIEPSFFEVTVAMAFDHFSRSGVDAAVIETGLGGRLDSTNVVCPALSVITNIGMDHMNILGDTLPAIATEKAGIIKQGVPAVVGERDPRTDDVFTSRAAATGSELRFAEDIFEVVSVSQEAGSLGVEVLDRRDGSRKSYRTDLPGLYQARNLLTVLAAVEELGKAGWKIPEAAVHNGLAHTKSKTGLRGRWETIRERPRVVLDVAHNEPGVRQLVRQMECVARDRLHIILAMVRDKDVRTVLKLLPRDARYSFTRAQTPRAMPEAELAELAASEGLTGDLHPDVHEALDAALRQAGQEDLIVVCGSVFLVGDVDPRIYADDGGQ